MGAIMMKLNTRAKSLATKALLALLVGLLDVFTLGYIPDQAEEITITRASPLSQRASSASPGRVN